jgi:hypothetical protein
MNFARAAVLAYVLFSSIILLSVPRICQAQPTYSVTEAFPNLSFNRPVGLCNAGDGSKRLFLVSQQGEIYVFENSENIQYMNLFLDIKNRVIFGGEQGLLGLAFDPNFASNGFFYVDYTADNPHRTVISRFSVSQSNPDQVDKTTEEVILEVPQPYVNHNGGQIAFGSDGYLYIALGDGGSGGDPSGNGQNRSTLLGSILRINVDTSSNLGAYSIPSDNPFVGNSDGYREEIYAYGLRNPWRFSFDPVTGWLWAADVGQDIMEEINIIQNGKNYGWNIMEGSLCYSPSSGCNTTGLELPIWEYDHNLSGSITGGFVYRGSELPSLIGDYIYSDYISGRIWALTYNGQRDPINRLLIDTNLNIVSFGVDENNELYICSFDNKIYKLVSSGESQIYIGSPLQVPLEPMPDQSVTVFVDLAADSGVQNIILSYNTDTKWTNVTMNLNKGNTYVADIPAMPDQTNVKYRIIAYDNQNNFAVNDNSGAFYSYLVIPEFSSALIFVAVFVMGTLAILAWKKQKDS